MYFGRNPARLGPVPFHSRGNRFYGRQQLNVGYIWQECRRRGSNFPHEFGFRQAGVFGQRGRQSTSDDPHLPDRFYRPALP